MHDQFQPSLRQAQSKPALASSERVRDRLIREDARLIMLKALRDQVDEQLNSALLTEILETFGGIRKTREWVHDELAWLAEMGAIRLVDAGTVKVACLLEKGAHHLDRRIAIDGVRRPSRFGV